MPTDYKAAALSRWPNARIWGNGDSQYAACRFWGDGVSDIYLCRTEAQAKNVILGFDRGRVFNLEPTPIPLNCKDIGWE